jgi:hypothetical protein
MTTDDERRAYARGYNTGIRGRWPLHRPPVPPDENAKLLVEALQNLRDWADNLRATLSEDDELVVELEPLLDAADEAMERLREWLTAGPNVPAAKCPEENSQEEA